MTNSIPKYSPMIDRWIPPNLPASVATFECVDFGGYCARGYNPNQIAARISGIPVSCFNSGEWLAVDNTGGSGSIFIFRDKQGKELGRVFKPSPGVTASLAREGKLSSQLLFRPTGERLGVS